MRFIGLVFVIFLILGCSPSPESRYLDAQQDTSWWAGGIELQATVRLLDDVLLRCYDKGAVQDGGFLASADRLEFGEDCSLAVRLEILNTADWAHGQSCFCQRGMPKTDIPTRYFPEGLTTIDLPLKGIIIMPVHESMLVLNKNDIVRGVLMARKQSWRYPDNQLRVSRTNTYWETFMVTGVENSTP